MALAKSPVESSAEHLNINISAYRVLYILLLLVQYRSLNVIELNRFLYENALIQRIYNTETLTKYINTLREVGCRIPRASNRNDYSYDLLKTPFPLRLEAEERAIAEKLLGQLCRQPDEMLCNDFREFLEKLAWCVECPPLSEEEHAEHCLQPFPELEARKKLLNTYRRYCQDAFTLDVRYHPEDAPLRELLVEPHEVVERGQHLMLVGTEQRSQEQISLDVARILSAKQLPSKNRRQVTQTVVVFALYGRLAKSYRLYPGEKIIYRAAEECHVKTKITEPSGLISRLLKYGPSCQVLSPEAIRKTMHQRIEQMLTALTLNVPET
ncbi:MAG TPA: WYL domain-containing protein [Coleofasciculaceae cyanobacterium]|jgi:predicted DNA-binding transcriptional regulator YafY